MLVLEVSSGFGIPSRWGRCEVKESQPCGDYSPYREPCKDMVWPEPRTPERHQQSGLHTCELCMLCRVHLSLHRTFTAPPVPGRRGAPSPLTSDRRVSSSESNFSLCPACWLVFFPVIHLQGGYSPWDTWGHFSLASCGRWKCQYSGRRHFLTRTGSSR